MSSRMPMVQMVPAILDSDVCDKPVLGGVWIATAQYV